MRSRYRGGHIDYISDFGSWFADDGSAGYEAGRHFLKEMKSFEWLLQAIGELEIPDLDG